MIRVLLTPLHEGTWVMVLGSCLDQDLIINIRKIRNQDSTLSNRVFLRHVTLKVTGANKLNLNKILPKLQGARAFLASWVTMATSVSRPGRTDVLGKGRNAFKNRTFNKRTDAFYLRAALKVIIIPQLSRLTLISTSSSSQ